MKVVRAMTETLATLALTSAPALASLSQRVSKVAATFTLNSVVNLLNGADTAVLAHEKTGVGYIALCGIGVVMVGERRGQRPPIDGPYVFCA